MRRGVTWLTVIVVCSAVGCAQKFPPTFPSSTYTRGQLTGAASDEPFTPPPAIEKKIQELVGAQFPAPWTFSEEDLKDAGKQHLLHGQQVYQEQCIHCHGLAGAGDGPTAPNLMPRPRDFRRGVFKWKSTRYAAKPTREDLIRLVRDGSNGTSMPPFRLIGEPDIRAAVDYVIYLSKRGELERGLLLLYSQEGPSMEEIASSGEALDPDDVEEIGELLAEVAEENIEALDGQWETAVDSVVEPPADVPVPAVDGNEFDPSVERGRLLFANAGCKECHGPDGRANPRVTKLPPDKALDLWGNENPPRNLTLGLFRGGRRPIDLYRRLHEGIAGSKMPGLGQNANISTSDIWDLVNLLRALPTEPDLLEQTQPEVETSGTDFPNDSDTASHNEPATGDDDA